MRQNLLTTGVFAILIALFAGAAFDWKLPWKRHEHAAAWCKAHDVELAKCET
jgi:hypothetical protein